MLKKITKQEKVFPFIATELRQGISILLGSVSFGSRSAWKVMHLSWNPFTVFPLVMINLHLESTIKSNIGFELNWNPNCGYGYVKLVTYILFGQYYLLLLTEESSWYLVPAKMIVLQQSSVSRKVKKALLHCAKFVRKPLAVHCLKKKKLRCQSILILTISMTFQKTKMTVILIIDILRTFNRFKMIKYDTKNISLNIKKI